MHESDVRIGGALRRPRWLVSNGGTVVGPVSTDLLLRGLEAGKVPTDCWIRDKDWNSWRQAHQIREVRGWCRQKFSLESSDESEKFQDRSIELASDLEEVVVFALEAAKAALAADVAVAHRVREPLWLPVTSCVHGLDPEGVLGQVVWHYDPAYATARQGRVVLDRSGGSSAARAIAARLWQPEKQPLGVAMFPVLEGDGVTAMIELARHDHPFRGSDVKTLTRIAFAAAAHLAGWDRSGQRAQPTRDPRG